MTWTLAVSTLITEELRILRFLDENRLALAQFDEVLFICQLRDKPLPDLAGKLPANCRVIESRTRGISASRNVGIENFTTDVIWFMDDDTKLVNLDRIRKAIEDSPADVNTLRIQDTKSEELFRDYRFKDELSSLQLLQVCSIEITCRKSFIDRTGIRFAEWIGVGTPLPSGEENLFLIDARRRGAKICHVPLVGSRHPKVDFELKAMWTRPGRTRSMGIIARQYGPIGLLLLARWGLRGLRSGVEARWLADLWRGYIRGSEGIPQNWRRLSTSRQPA
ncbi:MAG TPA: glycosyltransferase [Verrucomicrobiae bacterium]